AEVDLDGRLTLHDRDADRKLRVADLTWAPAVSGDINGTVKLSGVQFQAQLPMLGSVNWSGDWTATVEHNRVQRSERLTLPDYQALARDLARGLFAITGKLDF